MSPAKILLRFDVKYLAVGPERDNRSGGNQKRRSIETV
jgi:hypothetical protein